MVSRIREIQATSASYQNRENYERDIGRTPQLDVNAVIRPTGLDSVISSLDSFIESAKTKVEKSTLRAAQKAGSRAGLDPQFQEREDNTLAAEAYNRAGIEVFMNRTSVDMSARINEVATNPAFMNDPIGMSLALQDVSDAMSEHIPEGLYPEFITSFQVRAQQAINVAQQRAMTLQLSENEAAFLEAEASFVAEASNAARSGDENALSRLQAEYMSALDRQTGLTMSPAEVAKRKLEFNKQIQSDAVVGDFLRTPPEARLGFAREFINNNPLQGILSASEIDGLKRDMMRAWDVNENLEEQANAEVAATRTAAINEQLSAFYLAPNTDNYIKFVQMPGVTPAQIKAARTYMTTNLSRSDPVMQSAVEDAIYSGDYKTANEYLNDENTPSMLRRTDIQKYRRKLAEIQSGGGFEDTEAYKEVQRRIKEDYQINSIHGKGLSPEGTALRQQIYDKLRTDYPKYLAGELGYDDVDPMRMYALKKQNTAKVTTAPGTGAEVKTKNGVVVIPQKYVTDPASYQRELKEGLISDPKWRDPAVLDWMADRQIEILKQQKEKANVGP